MSKVLKAVPDTDNKKGAFKTRSKSQEPEVSEVSTEMKTTLDLRNKLYRNRRRAAAQGDTTAIEFRFFFKNSTALTKHNQA